MNHVEAAATYVDISRPEFEEWLATQGRRWSLKSGTSGIYQLHLSNSVAVEISSTLGRAGSNMGRANASMSMKLVSTVTGQTLNKKAQGQKYFTRTQNWRDNLAKGVERMKTAYKKASSFYEAIAEVEDREKYQKETLAAIESIDGWNSDRMLADFHSKVQGGGILSKKQKAAIDRASASERKVAPRGPEPSPEPQGLTPKQEAFLGRLRDLYRAARDEGDDWTMNFARDIGEKLKAGGYELSPRQRELILEKLKRYRV